MNKRSEPLTRRELIELTRLALRGLRHSQIFLARDDGTPERRDPQLMVVPKHSLLEIDSGEPSEQIAPFATIQLTDATFRAMMRADDVDALMGAFVEISDNEETQ